MRFWLKKVHLLFKIEVAVYSNKDIRHLDFLDNHAITCSLSSKQRKLKNNNRVDFSYRMDLLKFLTITKVDFFCDHFLKKAQTVPTQMNKSTNKVAFKYPLIGWLTAVPYNWLTHRTTLWLLDQWLSHHRIYDYRVNWSRLWNFKSSNLPVVTRQRQDQCNRCSTDELQSRIYLQNQLQVLF